MGGPAMVTDTFAVSAQIDPADMPALKAAGFTAIICNRPDGEDIDQPDHATVAAAAQAAGLSYAWVPMSGGLAPGLVDAMDAALVAAGDGKVLAYCRSGRRSVSLWALAQAWKRGADLEVILEAAARAGHDLSGMVSLLRQPPP